MSAHLSEVEREALAEARHRFWCNSVHHRAPHCRNSVESGVDANAIGNETEVIEAILDARVAAAVAAERERLARVCDLADGWQAEVEDDGDGLTNLSKVLDELRAALAAEVGGAR